MGKRIKVLQIVNGEFYGGAERVQEMIIKHLNPKLFNPYCVSLMDGEFVKEAKEKNLPVRVIPMRNKLDLSVVFKITSFVRRHGITLLHSHTERTNLVGRLAARYSGLPLVTHLHSSPLSNTNNPVKNRLNYFVDRLGWPYTTRFICVSNKLKEYLTARGVSTRRIEVINNGIETDKFRLSISKKEARKELGLDPPAKIMAMIALFRPLKGLECLLEALRYLHANGREVNCLLVGDFEKIGYEKKIRKRIHQLKLEDNITFLGFRKDIKRILSAVDLVVFPSLFGEGMPISILEAMAMGRPVVASKVGGIPEVIRDGETGMLVPPGESKKLGEAITQLFEDPDLCSRLGSNARSLVRERHNALNMVESIEEVYRQAVEDQ